ncbi:MAG TPA: ABC transporter ATP-binding protein [Candidatus Gallimonas intestinigallinarum]|uniref:ABC transporter ATP-binding protein n=1 Tax=Candidatus Gallimonas intestinigallinarum TaxID=2838604 RepID=A0A9D2DX23_9FIRM|nr:ABC transporter ATP-binding protein [Candidatus Gallimonas intestinigallinarum]
MAVATQYYADHEEGRISIENLNMVYETDKGDKVTALTDVNLEIESGSFVSLLGPSGCGKTTLLRIIADLITPTSGAVSVGGMSPTEARMARKLGMVFQSAVLYDWRSVLKNVEMPLEIMHLPKGERRDRAEHMLEMVGLKDFAHRYPYELSGGMQQRVSIARALAVNPRILLMDEPFSALDEFTREKLHDDLLGIWKENKMTIVFVTHNISESVYLSDKVVVMSPHPGRVSAVLDIDLTRPRCAQMRETEEYYDYIAEIRSDFEGV